MNFLKQNWKVIVVIIIVFLMGYFIRPYLSTRINKSIKFYSSGFTNEFQNNEYSCDSVADVSLYKDIVKDKLYTSLGKGTDKVSIKIDSPNKFITLLTRAGMEAGATEGERFPIIEENENQIVAITKLGILGPNYSILIFNKKTAKGIWTKTSDALGMSGSVIYLSCY